MTAVSIFLACLAVLAGTGQAPPSPAARPSPKPTPPPVIEGTVNGPDGKPVEGALVVAVPPRFSALDPPLTARTDAEGHFRLEAGRAEPHSVSVQARGLAIARLERVRTGERMTVTLQKGGAIEGTVRDSEGRPVKGAHVQASATGVVVPLSWEPEAGVATAVSDVRGRYRLEGVSPGLQVVTATAPGFGSARRTNARAASVVDLTLLPGGWISGTVVGHDGSPVAGALVRADVEARYFTGRPEVADDAGRFAIAGLEPGVYTVVAWRKDFAPGMASGVRVERDAETRAEVALAAGVRLTGRLVGDAGQPVAGRVYVQDLEGRPVPRSLTEVLGVEAAPDGRFAIDRAPPGDLTLAVLGRGHAPRRVEVRIGPREAVVDLGEITLEVGLAISGRVRSKAGTAVPEARVSAWRRGPSTSALPGPLETGSEADGRFTLAGLEPGSYQVSASAPGYAQTSKKADAGADAVDLVLAPGGAITGLVVDERDRPIETYTVTWETPDGHGRGRKNVSGADGRFALEDLGEGAYALRVDAPEAAPGTVSGVEVTAGQSLDVGTIRLGRGGIVRGTVVDGAGAPVAGATIAVQTATQMWRAVPVRAESDGAGAFEVKGVPAGKVDLMARHPSYAPGGVSGLDVDPAKEPTVARVVLTQGGRIEGWARRRDGTALADTTVGVRSLTGIEEVFAPPPAVTPLPDGSFVIDHIPAGRAFVSLMASATGRTSTLQGREVEIREGQTTTVDFSVRDILVSGRVSRGDAPLAGVRVTVHPRSHGGGFGGGGPPRVPAPASGPQRLTALTGEDGSYELIASEPGKTMVGVESADGRVRFPWRDVEIPDADTFVLDLAYAGLTLGGVVVDGESGQPVPEAWVSASPRRKDVRGSSGSSGPDGRFTLEVEPGEYQLRVRDQQHAPFTSELTVEPGGAPEVRVELARGFALEGKVVDGAGRPMPGFRVSASRSDSTAGPFENWGAHTLPDGTFRIEGLLPRPHTLATGSAVAGYSILTGVTPGGAGLVLRLRPGGRIRATTVGADGAPVSQALAWIAKVDGVVVYLLDFESLPTDTQGFTELGSPTGTVEIGAENGRLTGRVTVSVPAGGIVEARIELKKEAAPPPR